MSIRDMVDSIMADDEDEEPGDAPGGGDSLGGGGGLMGEEDGDEMSGGDDDLGGLGGLDDDGEDLGGFDDDGFGEMEGGDDAMAGGGGNIDELEHRLDELENEVGSLSSTVNTVRNENEQISNSVEEVEENVRKLLDIYEMVTRGVNPFADEMDAGMGMGGGMEAEEGSFGLFTDDDAGEEDESVDEDIADADAEGFFDDDLVDEPDVDDGMDAGDEFDDAADEADDSGGGTSFEDLKDEYESGEADWDEEDEEFDDVGGEFEDAGEEFEDVGDDEFGEAADEGEAGGFADDELFDETVEGSETVAETAEDSGTAAETEATSQQAVDTATGTTAESSTGSSAGGKPYIGTVPEGFAADLIVVEWLEFLVQEAGIRETAKALNYYESVDWLSAEAADELETYLSGFEDSRRGSLQIDHHKRSLEFINQLNGNTAAGPDGVTGIKR